MSQFLLAVYSSDEPRQPMTPQGDAGRLRTR